MKVFTTLITALFCTLPAANSWADTQNQTPDIPENLAAERAGIKTINQPKDNAKHVRTLYKDLDQDGVEDRFDQCLNTGAGIAVDEFGCELDSDKDGIYDRFDQCPGTPRGISVNFLGCEGDQDKDGVVDSKDECPNTPLGTKVDAKGCEIDIDQDKDGVPDEIDLCPNTPQGSTVNQHGCIAETLVISNIVFDTASFYIRADQRPILESDAAKLRKLEITEVLIITGHTDIVGDADYNVGLSWNRAQSTKDYLVKTFNIPAEQIYVQGKGKVQPIATNDTAEGRQKNRRIELEIKSAQELSPGIQKDIPKEIRNATHFKLN